METYIYMPPVKIGDSFQKHKIELIQQKEKKCIVDFVLILFLMLWFISKISFIPQNIMELKGVWQQILSLMDVTNQSYLEMSTSTAVAQLHQISQLFLILWPLYRIFSLNTLFVYIWQRNFIWKTLCISYENMETWYLWTQDSLLYYSCFNIIFSAHKTE